MHFFLPHCVFCIDCDICPRFQSLNQNCFSSQHSAILLSTQTVLCTDFSRHFACLWSKIAESASPTPSIQYHVDLLYCSSFIKHKNLRNSFFAGEIKKSFVLCKRMPL